MAVDFNYPYQITKDTPALASEVQDNFNQLLAWLKTNYRQVDDSPNLTQQLVLPGEPTISSHAVNLGYLESSQLLPRGTVLAYGGTTTPSGYLACDGAAYSTTGQYAGLFAVIGYQFGDPGGGNFNVPDLRGRTVIGVNSGGSYGLSVGATGGSSDAISVSHTHTGTTVSDSHNHSQYIRANTGYYTGPNPDPDKVLTPSMSISWLPEKTSSDAHTHALLVDDAGQPGLLANLQPYAALDYIIKT